jgi:hypothetical protein
LQPDIKNRNVFSDRARAHARNRLSVKNIKPDNDYECEQE